MSCIIMERLKDHEIETFTSQQVKQVTIKYHTRESFYQSFLKFNNYLVLKLIKWLYFLLEAGGWPHEDATNSLLCGNKSGMLSYRARYPHVLPFLLLSGIMAVRERIGRQSSACPILQFQTSILLMEMLPLVSASNLCDAVCPLDLLFYWCWICYSIGKDSFLRIHDYDYFIEYKTRSMNHCSTYH